MDGENQTSTRRRRLNSGASLPRLYDTSARVTVAGLLGILIAAALVLPGFMTPAVARPQSDPEQGLFPANLVLELSDEHISGDGRQVVRSTLSPSRETFDDLLLIERARQPELSHHQMNSRDRSKNATPEPQNRIDANHRKNRHQ